MLKGKNKHVMATEELAETQQADLACQYTNLPLQFRGRGGRSGEQKEQRPPCDESCFLKGFCRVQFLHRFE